MTAITLSDYREDYLARRQKTQSEATTKQKAITIQHFTDWLDDEQLTIDPDQPYVALDAVRDFFSTDRLTISPTRLAHIRDFLEFVSKRLDSTRDQDKLLDIKEKVKKNRWPDEVFETDEKEPEFVSDEVICKACHAASARGERVIRFLFETGCRLGEMRAITVNDIDFDHSEVGAAVSVTKKKTETGEIEDPKTQAGFRTVELTPTTAQLLRNHIENSTLNADGEVFSMSPNTYRNDVQAGFTAVNICLDPETGETFLTPHWLRHNRNTRIKKEHGTEAAQQYMGHKHEEGRKDAAMTDHYTHYDPEEVQGIVGIREWCEEPDRE